MLHIFHTYGFKCFCTCFICMFHMLQWLYTYVVSFCSQCFICFFIRMLQVCLFGCRICFTHMLQVFYRDVVYVFSYLCCIYFTHMVSSVFARVSYACSICCNGCTHMFLHTYVASVASECFKSRSGVTYLSSPSVASPRCLLLLPASAGHSPPPSPLLDASDVWGGVGPAWVRKMTWETDCRRGRPDTPSVQTSGR